MLFRKIKKKEPNSKQPKKKYKYITNWRTYNEKLVKRGEVKEVYKEKVAFSITFEDGRDNKEVPKLKVEAEKYGRIEVHRRCKRALFSQKRGNFFCSSEIK